MSPAAVTTARSGRPAPPARAAAAGPRPPATPTRKCTGRQPCPSSRANWKPRWIASRYEPLSSSPGTPPACQAHGDHSRSVTCGADGHALSTAVTVDLRMPDVHQLRNAEQVDLVRHDQGGLPPRGNPKASKLLRDRSPRNTGTPTRPRSGMIGVMDCVIVSHTHWDREWYRTFQAFRARLVDTVDKVLEVLDRDPGWSFVLDGQTIVVEDYLAIRPGQAERLAAACRAGRLAIGPWYVQPDSLLPS